MNYTEELQSNRQFWEKILGNEICENLLNREFQQLDDNDLDLKLIEELYQKVLENDEREECTQDDGTFSDFDAFFIKIACLYKKTQEENLLENTESDIAYNLSKRIKPVSLRVLIQDINEKKKKNELEGSGSKEEYENYRKKYLKDSSYIHKLCEKYPEMRRLIFLQIYQLIRLFGDIEIALKKNKKELIEQFCAGKSFSKIQKIECGFSDFHNGGKAVARVKLDNGYTLIYKPQSLEKELVFQKIYSHFLKNAGLKDHKIQVLDCGNYGWEECVCREECQNIQEIERYFERMGVLLLLCYLLNANDIHQENIIAFGEYPFLVDLETFPGNKQEKSVQNADQKVREDIGRSVLAAGLLPVMVWGNSGEGIIVNALHGRRKELTPFRIPFVCQWGSSEIHIEYRQKEIAVGTSLPVYKGKEVNPADYEIQMLQGFKKAYSFVLNHKEHLTEVLEPLFAFKGRMLLRHTQQYSMFLQTSLYPEFLESEVKRDLFLHVLDKQQMPEEITLYERQALRQMDVPIFCVSGKEKRLYAGDNVQDLEFYRKSAYQLWKEKMDRISEADLESQLRFIRLSMALLEREPLQRRHLERKDAPILETEKVVRQIADEICQMAVIYEPTEDISWSGLRFFEEKSWSFVPMGMYLYDGIGGVALFLSMVVKRYEDSQYHKVWSLVVKKLFGYTDQVLDGKRKTESEHSGAFIGEGSLVHTYFLLYRITGRPVFLEYARRHVLVVERTIENDKSPDLLSGIAGTIVVISKLYQELGDERYLKMAIHWGEKLWEKSQKQEEGYGIPIFEGEKPLAGMAHGNSGYIIAYAYLLELTGDVTYSQRIRLLLDYEDSLFCSESGNWLDLRNKERKEASTNAWCHGAAGILLSRLKLRKIREFQGDIRVERDISRCLRAFDVCKPPKSSCLCHGLAGHYQILKYYFEQSMDVRVEGKLEELRQDILEEWGDEEGMLPQERYNVALMTGIAGIGMALWCYK